MNKLLSICAAITVSVAAFAQDEAQLVPSASSRDYHQYRVAITEPAYGLAKVRGMISRIKKSQEGDSRLSDEAFAKLSIAERFTYVMIHAEEFSQNCAIMPPIENEDQKIFAFPAEPFGDEAVWSPRERTFMEKNRAKVIPLIRSTIHAHNRVGANLKQAIVLLNGKELIPDLISVFQRDKKDCDILTVLMTLMKEGKYKPFLESVSYKKLYGNEESSYKAFLVANGANKQLVVDRASAYYKSLK